MAKNRASSKCDVLPTMNDFIEVLWEMDEGKETATVWWRAEARNVKRDNSRKGIIGTGILRYDEYMNYPSSDERVEFLPRRCLRVAHDPRDDNNVDENENPSLSWRVHVRYDSVLRDHEDRCERSDEEWDVSDPIMLMENQVDTKKRDASSLISLTNVLSQVKKMKECHERVLAEMLYMRRNVMESSRMLRGTEFVSDIDVVQRVTSYLRNRLSVKLEKPLRKYSKSIDLSEDTTHFSDRISASSVRLKADCDLDEFEAIARNVQQRYCLNESFGAVQFFPPFSMTQNPNLGANEFFIIFPSMRRLFELLGITSKCDRIRMLQRYGTTGKSALLRVLGAYVCDQDESQPSSIVPGRSCLGTVVDVVPTDSTKRSVVLRRDSEDWSLVDRRYRMPLYRASGTITTTADFPKSAEVNNKAFLLHWRRDTDPSTRLWSKEICRSTRVTGSLEVVLPCTIIPSDVLVDEVENLMDEETVEKACDL